MLSQHDPVKAGPLAWRAGPHPAAVSGNQGGHQPELLAAAQRGRRQAWRMCPCLGLPFPQRSPRLRCPQALLGSRPHFLTGPPMGLSGEPQPGVQTSLRAVCHLSLPLGSLCCCLSTLDPRPLSSMPISSIGTLCPVRLLPPSPKSHCSASHRSSYLEPWRAVGLCTGFSCSHGWRVACSSHTRAAGEVAEDGP